MRRSKTDMNYGNVLKKLKKGVAIQDRYKKASVELQKIMVRSAAKAGLTNRPADLGDFGADDFFEKIKSGDMLPDEVYGWSIKSILTILLVLLVLKLKAKG